jgi:hypothetical protein
MRVLKGEGVVGVVSKWTKREVYPTAVRSAGYSPVALEGVRWGDTKDPEGTLEWDARLRDEVDGRLWGGEHGTGEPGCTLDAQAEMLAYGWGALLELDLLRDERVRGGGRLCC